MTDDEEFRAFVREAGLASGTVNLEDLRLAWKSRRRDPVALAELDRRIRAVCAALRRREGLVVLELDELCQRVRERLVVRDRLAAYRGKGALVKWLQAVAASIAIDAARAQHARKEDDDDELLAAAASDESAEARLLKSSGNKAFSAAFKAALEELPARDRTVMRMRYVDQANLDDIAKTYGVHRTSVMRWLEASHRAVLAGTRERLVKQLKLSGAELDSLIRGLELSFSERVSRLFAKTR